MHIAILIACFNRVNTTLASLGTLRSALDKVENLEYRIFLLDDASSDGTGDAVRSTFPGVHVINGTGSLYWARGTGKAFEAARRSGSFDAYLLFNDDVIVDSDKVRSFFNDYREANSRASSILSGATLAKDRTRITYSGFRKISNFRPRASEQLFPDGTLRPMDMPNGNFLLCPGPFFESIGGLDPAYTHGHADIDLGLVAKRKGLGVFLARQPVGLCDANRIMETLKKVSFRERWKILQRPMFRLSDYSHFALKHYPKMFYGIYLAVFLLRRVQLLMMPRRVE